MESEYSNENTSSQPFMESKYQNENILPQPPMESDYPNENTLPQPPMESKYQNENTSPQPPMESEYQNQLSFQTINNENMLPEFETHINDYIDNMNENNAILKVNGTFKD